MRILSVQLGAVVGWVAWLMATGCQEPTAPPATALPDADRPARSAARGETPVSAAAPPTPRQLFPGIRWDPSRATLEVAGRICIEHGILEYVAVASGGKEYESLVALHCRPSQLKAAMLVADFEAGDVAVDVKGDFAPPVDATTQPAVVTPSRPSDPTCVHIDVAVASAPGEWDRMSIERFLIDRRTGRPPDRLTWAFTGSFFYRDEQTGTDYFVADAERSIVALWYDPTALLNLTLDVGNPYRGDGVGLEVEAAHLPAVGTPVTLMLQRVAPRK